MEYLLQNAHGRNTVDDWKRPYRTNAVWGGITLDEYKSPSYMHEVSDVYMNRITLESEEAARLMLTLRGTFSTQGPIVGHRNRMLNVAVLVEGIRVVVVASVPIAVIDVVQAPVL